MSEEFEKWAMSMFFALAKDGEHYKNWTTEMLWAAWQASRKQALGEAADICIEHDYAESAESAIRKLQQQ
jgi:hypothetical protein